MKRKQTFDEKNELITVRPKKIIEQVRTFDGESDFIVPRKNTYIDKKSNTIVSLARDNSHSSVDTVGEYANAAAAGGSSACPTIVFSATANPLNNTSFQVAINAISGGQAPYSSTIVYSNGGNNTNLPTTPIAAQGGSFQTTGFPNPASVGGIQGGTYTVSVSITDANGCQADNNPIILTVPLQGTSNPPQPTITKLNSLVMNATSPSFPISQQNKINVSCSYQDGKAPYTIEYKAIDSQSNNVVSQVIQTNNKSDSYQFTQMNAVLHNVIVTVTDADGTVLSDNKSVTVKGQSSSSGSGTTFIKNVPAVTIQNFQASTAVLQPDTISVSVSYQDGKAPYTVDYTITDQNGVVTAQQSNTVNSLQDSLQPSPSGLSSGQYTVTVKVTGSDNSSDSRTEIVNVVGKTVVQSNLKLNNLNVTTTNLTTSGFDVNLSWSDGTSPYQVNAIVKSSGFAANHVMSESSKTHSWTQSLLVDNSGNPIYGNYDIGVEVTDSIGDVVQGFTQIFVPAPKPKPLSGILTETNKQNASFDVDYKFYNGVAPYTLTATLFHPVDASGNSQSFPINEVNLTNNGVFPVIITPMAGGAVLEGYYKMNNCVVTDANGQTANLNDLSVYLNGVKANIAPPPPPPPPPPTTTPTPIIGGGGSVIIGGGGGGVIPTVEPVVVAPKEKTGINWLLVIIALGVGYAIIRKKQ